MRVLSIDEFQPGVMAKRGGNAVGPTRCVGPTALSEMDDYQFEPRMSPAIRCHGCPPGQRGYARGDEANAAVGQSGINASRVRRTGVAAIAVIGTPSCYPTPG